MVPLDRSDTHALKLGYYPTKNVDALPSNQATGCGQWKGYLSVGVTAGLPTVTAQNRYPTERHFLSTAAHIKVGIAQQ